MCNAIKMAAEGKGVFVPAATARSGLRLRALVLRGCRLRGQTRNMIGDACGVLATESAHHLHEEATGSITLEFGKDEEIEEDDRRKGLCSSAKCW